MIEWRFGLEPLTVRDAAANNLADVLDFQAAPDLAARRYDVPDIQACGCQFTGHAAGDVHAGHDWPTLRECATNLGYLPA
jgi:phospholipase C